MTAQLSDHSSKKSFSGCMKRTNQKLIYLRGQDFSQASSKNPTYHVCDILNDWVLMFGVESLWYKSSRKTLCTNWIQ